MSKTAELITLVPTPPRNRARYCLNGDWDNSVVYYVAKSPCWLHRLTQRLLLGIHWQLI